MRNPLLAAAFVLAAGCALTRSEPDTPELPLPDALPPVAQALPELLAPWWRVFDDPALDALIREALEAESRHRHRRGPRRRGARHRACRERRPAAVGRTGGRCRALARKRADAAGARAQTTQTSYYVQGSVRYELDLWGRYAHASEAARAAACLRGRPGSGAAEPERRSRSRLRMRSRRRATSSPTLREHARQPRGIAAHRANPRGRWRERRVHAQARTGGGCSDPHGGAAVRASRSCAAPNALAVLLGARRARWWTAACCRTVNCPTPRRSCPAGLPLGSVPRAASRYTRGRSEISMGGRCGRGRRPSGSLPRASA